MILTCIMAGITLVGSVLNARKLRIGFLFWSVTNFYWIVRNFMIGEYAQAAVYAVNLCISIYGFVKWVAPYRNINKFYVREEQELITWVYYNPDSNAGGQYILNEFDFNLVYEAESNSDSSYEFFEFIGLRCKQYLSDKGTYDFKVKDREHRRKKASFTGANEDTMLALIALTKQGNEGE